MQPDRTTQAENNKHRFYRPELDLLQFIAFLLVFFAHEIPPHSQADYYRFFSALSAQILYSIANAVNYGLCLFFFLSAFLITDILAKEKARTSTVHIGKFYVRRILRIWPLYFLGILIGGTIEYYAGGDLRMFLFYCLLVGNWFFMYHRWSGNPMTPLWSISIEEQFYLFWPVTMKFLSARMIYLVSAAMVAVAIATEIYFGEIHADTNTEIWASSFVQFEFFAAGSITALLLKGRAPSFPPWRRLCLAGAGAFLWFASVFWFGAKVIGPAISGPCLVIGYLLVTAGCVSIFLSIIGMTAKIPWVLIYLGRISYGLYVFHLLAINITGNIYSILPEGARLPVTALLFHLVGAFLLTVLLAAVSYRYFETPFLLLKERFALVKSRPV